MDYCPVPMNPIDFLYQRWSVPSRLLGEPGPDQTTVLRMLDIALRVPDHGRLRPWRFVRISGEARHRLGEYLAEVYLHEHPDAEARVLDKERNRFAYAPLVIAVVGCIQNGHRIPEVEQRASAAALCFQLLLAAKACGYCAQWLTSWAAYHPQILARLGLTPNEEIVGFIHIGTAQGELPDRERPDAAGLLTDWSG